MISNPFIYLLVLASLATLLYLLESKFHFKIFKFLPAVVLVYAISMVLASFGLFESNTQIQEVYKTTKTNLLPAMLFLFLLQVNLRDFVRLGKSLLIAYFFAVSSIAFAFVVVVYGFSFSEEMRGAFGALAGSWMGGTANMIAVGSALGVTEEAFAYALIVDSVNYTLWVMLLLFLVPFAKYFNTFTGAAYKEAYLGEIGCACTLGTKRYALLLLLALLASLLSQYASVALPPLINSTTSTVVIATLFGIVGSFTKLKELGGSSELATSMLYLLIALIGSQAVIESFSGVGTYVFAGFCILLVHIFIMLIVANIFQLDLFSIGVASLANIGGVASAPILAATYNKNLVSVGVVMAIMGYIIGTFGGLVVGNILLSLHSM